MAHRSPARWLAPLALVTCAVAVFAVVGNGSGGGDDGGGRSTTEQRRAPKGTGTTEQRTTSTPRKASSGRPRTYTVKAGDTPSAIAAALGVTVQELLEANPDVDAQTLRVGQQLEIPQ